MVQRKHLHSKRRSREIAKKYQTKARLNPSRANSKSWNTCPVHEAQKHRITGITSSGHPALSRGPVLLFAYGFPQQIYHVPGTYIISKAHYNWGITFTAPYTAHWATPNRIQTCYTLPAATGVFGLSLSRQCSSCILHACKESVACVCVVKAQKTFP